MKHSRLWSVVVCALCAGPLAVAGDWPQFRYDAGRTAASPEDLAETLSPKWMRHLPTPRPAFPNEVRLLYDATYEPVVFGKTMFVPSMVTDSLTAFDTTTGKLRWRFYADGPVRFAPVAWRSRVCFASDDGFLYCLSDAGQLLWKVRGLPKDKVERNLLGNGRLIALRPARGAPVLHDGVIYFAAGIWLGEGVYIHAVDAESGELLWSNTESNLLAKTNLDHGVKGVAGLSPQGYLAAVGEKLVVPCGAQLPGFLDLKTGTLEPYTMGWGGRVGLPKGSWLAAGAGQYLVHSGDLFDLSRANDERFRDPRGRPDFKSQLYPGGYMRVMIDPTNQRALGGFQKPVITNGALYTRVAEGRIVAYDLTKPKLVQRASTQKPAYRRSDQYPDKWKATFPELWSFESELDVHIRAGSRLFVAGPGIVQAVEAPAGDGTPRISWQAKVEGTPHSLLAADGKLFVVTREGRIYAFGNEPSAQEVVHSTKSTVPSAPDDKWTARTAQILREARVQDGYALVLGAGSGRLAEELVRQSKLFVIVVDADAEKVSTLRRRFHTAGWYGSRVSVHAADPLSFSFPPFLASLILCEDASVLDALDSSAIKRLYAVLRPYGGTACFGTVDSRRTAIRQAVNNTGLNGADVRETDQNVLIARAGPLPGAADWSHIGANADNSGATHDKYLKPPLSMLWYDGSVRWHRKPGSAVIRVAHGRVFILADKLLAVDAFTGRHLWEVSLPAPLPLPRPEFVAVEDGVYIPNGKTCVVLDPRTGETTARINVPNNLAEDEQAGWSRLRVAGDLLIGAVGRHVVCFDRHNGKLLWESECQHGKLSLAVGPDRVFCAEIRKLSRKPTPSELKAKPRTTAYDLKTGKMLWQAADASELRYSEPHDLLITHSAVYRGKDGSVVRKHDAPYFIAGDLLVSTTPDELTTRDLLTGSKTTDDTKWYRRGCTGLRACTFLATTRFEANAAYLDFETRRITSLWNVRSGCNNNLVPADGLLNVPNLTGGCECNYAPVSQALAPSSAFPPDVAGR